jgi:hypothetical protein
MLSLIQEVITALTPVKRTHTVLLLGLEHAGKNRPPLRPGPRCTETGGHNSSSLDTETP